jgi:hypothetical protein
MCKCAYIWMYMYDCIFYPGAVTVGKTRLLSFCVAGVNILIHFSNADNSAETSFPPRTGSLAAK